MNDDKDSGSGGAIDAHLRRAFQEIETKPIPDRLLSLLEQLRAQDGPALSGEETAEDSVPDAKASRG